MPQSAGSTRGSGGHAFPQQSCFLLLVNSSLILNPSGASRRSRSTSCFGGWEVGMGTLSHQALIKDLGCVQ